MGGGGSNRSGTIPLTKAQTAQRQVPDSPGKFNYVHPQRFFLASRGDTAHLA